jgi:hypothetical protein
VVRVEREESVSKRLMESRVMGDEDGPFIAEHFYKKMLNDKAIDFDAIPYALDHAVSELRKKGVPAERWATFIHMGA